MSAVGQKKLRDEINLKYLWHLRLGHIGEDKINRLERDEILNLIKSESILANESYLWEKISRLPFMGQGERATELLALVHTDVYGPFDV